MDDSDKTLVYTNNEQLHLQSPEAVEYHLEIAGIGARSHAFIIDWHIRLLLALSWFLGVGLMMFSWDELRSLIWQRNDNISLIILLAPTAIIYSLYHPILEIAMAGRTPGKRMVGVRIVTTEGLTPSAGSLLLRNIFRLLDCLPSFYCVGLIVCATNQHRARIGDLAAGLLLVYDHQINNEQLHKITDLAIHSSLSPNDQSLLLDLLARWQQLDADDKIRLAEKYLRHIGEPIKASSDKPILRVTELQQQLQQLTQVKGSH